MRPPRAEIHSRFVASCVGKRRRSLVLSNSAHSLCSFTRLMFAARRLFTGRVAQAAAGVAASAIVLHEQRTRQPASAEQQQLLMQTTSDKPLLFAWGRLAPASDAETQVRVKTREPCDVSFWSAQGLTVKQLSYGESYGAALDNKGGLWAWGESAGPVPRRVPCKMPISSLASTSTGLYALTSKGRVLEWRDLDAALATPAALAEPPKQLGGALARTTATSIAAGDAHLLVVGKSGEVVVLGDNSRGQLGLGLDPATNPRRVEPTLLTTLPDGAKATSAACGAAHSLVVLSDGGVLAFGDDRNLQLGLRQRTPKNMRDIKNGAQIVTSPCVLRCSRSPDFDLSGHWPSCYRSRLATAFALLTTRIVVSRPRPTGRECRIFLRASKPWAWRRVAAASRVGIASSSCAATTAMSCGRAATAASACLACALSPISRSSSRSRLSPS